MRKKNLPATIIYLYYYNYSSTSSSSSSFVLLVLLSQSSTRLRRRRRPSCIPILGRRVQRRCGRHRARARSRSQTAARVWSPRDNNTTRNQLAGRTIIISQ